MRYLLIIVAALICGGCANVRTPVITMGMSHGEVMTEMDKVNPPAFEEAQVTETRDLGDGPRTTNIFLYRQLRYDGGRVHIKVAEQGGLVVGVTYLGY